MESILPYAVWTVLILLGLGLLAMGIFGIRSLFYGKINALTLVIVVLPIALLGILGVVMGDWALAGVYTLLIMLALAALSLFLSGVRSMMGL